MTELSQQACALIEQGRRLDAPPPGAKARLAEALQARIEAGEGPSMDLGGESISSTASASAGVGGAAPWVGGAAALGVAAAAVMLWPGAPSEAGRATMPVPTRVTPSEFDSVRLKPAEGSTSKAPRADRPASAEVVKAGGEQAESREASDADPSDADAHRRAAPQAERDGAGGDLLAEARLMADAQRALRDQDWQLALERTETHRRRFPEGVLREERWGVSALARCALGQRAEGLELRARLEAANSSSALLPRIDQKCR